MVSRLRRLRWWAWLLIALAGTIVGYLVWLAAYVLMSENTSV